MICQKDIRDFSEGLTVIGGYTQYEVDIDSQRRLIGITRKLSYSFLTVKEIVEEIRAAFKMPAEQYPFKSILMTKKGIRVRFDMPQSIKFYEESGCCRISP
jgi:hypothetical protein